MSPRRSIQAFDGPSTIHAPGSHGPTEPLSSPSGSSWWHQARSASNRPGARSVRLACVAWILRTPCRAGRLYVDAANRSERVIWMVASHRAAPAPAAFGRAGLAAWRSNLVARKAQFLWQMPSPGSEALPLCIQTPLAARTHSRRGSCSLPPLVGSTAGEEAYKVLFLCSVSRSRRRDNCALRNKFFVLMVKLRISTAELSRLDFRANVRNTFLAAFAECVKGLAKARFSDAAGARWGDRGKSSQRSSDQLLSRKTPYDFGATPSGQTQRSTP